MAAGAKYATFAASDTLAKPPPPSPAHPQAAASWLSRVFMQWVTPLMALGNTKQLDQKDMWQLQRHHHAAVVTVKFCKDFENSRSITWAFLQSFGGRFATTGVAFFVAAASSLVGPLVLNHVVTELSSGQYDVQDLALWIVGLLVTQFIQALADNYANFDSEVMAIQFTAGLKNLLFRKSLRLNADARKQKSTGDITNLYTTDCDMIPACAYCVHLLWILPLQIFVVSWQLYKLLGNAAFAGFGVMAAVFVISQLMFVRIYALYTTFMACKDARLKTVTEAFKSISVVKFNGWEDKFLARIGDARAKELATIWSFMKFNSLTIVMSWGLPVFISVSSFSVYTHVLHKELTPAVVFTSIALFQLVQMPLQAVPSIIAACVMSKVGERRINAFLMMPELDADSVLTINAPEADAYIAKNVIVAMDNNASFTWGAAAAATATEAAAPLLLKDVNLQVKVGDFVVVHGPVGCGKSSLCSALLGDMTKTQGTVYVGGSVAYCAQQAWIQHATVRDNILFGGAFDKKKYDQVLDACALTQDLKSLPSGDKTEIGERGVNLSGGQKARVALARACYSDASVYILDAPLSAVDAIVQNEIFQKCLVGLLRNRTIILVTHNPEIIASKYVTKAVTINEDGQVVETRAIQEGEQRPQVDASSVITPLASKAYVKSIGDEACDELHSEEITDKHELLDVLDLNDTSLGLKSPRHYAAGNSGYEDASTVVGGKAAADGADETHRLVEDEERKEGRVGFHVFQAYYRAVGGFPVVFIVLMSQVLWQGFQISSDFWLSHWSTDSSASKTLQDGGVDSIPTESYRIKVYTILGLTSAFMVVVRTLMVSYFGLRAARRMFDNMTKALMHAPMKFYDANPIGRILMRYTNDVGDVDLQLPLSFGGFFANLFAVACTMATTAFIIQWKGLFLVPIAVLYVQVANFYLQPAREVQRVMATTEAPILSHLSESIEGGSTIRAFGPHQLMRFQNTNDIKLDASNQVWYARLSISKWFGLRIQLLGTVLVFIVAGSLVMLHDTLSAAIVGLAFTYVLKVSNSMESIVQAWSSVETKMVSPERLQQYTDVEQEAPHSIPSVDPPASLQWPANGAITFENVSFRYKETDALVLKDLNFSVQGGEKIGIVGRTGAGKSSLTMALFRINELAAGQVVIDGINVGKIGLKALRSKMSIIPQNPVLFKGPLRKYLDPFDEYSDDQMWDALRRVGLSDRITSEDDKLEHIVEENGENFSVGERQMLCMARALLRDSRIVIFDEATAAIDHETDQKLQQVIREAFDKSTVLTIAHRLDTILDSDRILVLDAGRVVEFASPAQLVKKGNGHFFDLMQEGGYLDKFLSNQ